MAKTNRCFFSCTKYVAYECLYKPRTVPKDNDKRLRDKLQKEIENGFFPSYSISIDDLQMIMNLEQRKALSKGELSSIVFAQKTRQAFLTDDQKARKLSEFHIGLENTQTIPHLFGWLSYTGKILDNDKVKIVQEHENNGGQLSKFFDDVFLKALELIQIEKSQSSECINFI
jgi:predicted nucleic acid-binding protein